MIPLETGSAARSSEGGAPTPDEVRRALWGVYCAAMRRYVSNDGGVLARSIQRTEDGWIVSEPCPLNTAEMLKAAFLMDARGVRHPLDASALLDRMMTSHMAEADYQLVALTLWAAAIGRSSHTALLWQLLRDKLPADASQSMQLGWTLSAICALYGLCTSEGSQVDSLDRIATVAHTVYDRLVANQDARTGLFYASTRREGWLRRRVADATLSSQTYPILALASYARTIGVSEAFERAQRCADRLSALQGPQGQWGWRYDARRGTVRERYPVYCVNQDSAVPAALGQLQLGLGDTRYDVAIARGLAWQAGDNETSYSLLDEASGFVARSLEITPTGVHCSWEMYAYQPARFIFTVLSNPVWASEVVS